MLEIFWFEEVENMVDLKSLINEFWKYAADAKIELYNEFSLQHELGIFLRSRLDGYRVQFERNISYFGITDDCIKKEIDIAIFTPDMKERLAIELKYPRNGQYPEQMYSFVKDIKFMEHLRNVGFRETFALTLVDDRNFYSGDNKRGIYGYFRGGICLNRNVYKPTGKMKDIEYISIQGNYKIDWKKLNDNRMYYIVQTI